MEFIKYLEKVVFPDPKSPDRQIMSPFFKLMDTSLQNFFRPSKFKLRVSSGKL